MATERPRGKEPLTDPLIASITRRIDINQVKMMAVVFMKISSQRVANITSEADEDSQKVARELFVYWRNRTQATVQVIFVHIYNLAFPSHCLL